ncbi:MAG: hypothetical protein UFJ02_03555 [Prevotella sp.]|nr:hypothetical protein [Prevotella sp.]
MGRRFVIFWLFAAQSGNLSECIHDFSSVHHKSHAATMKEKILDGRQKASHTPGTRREIAVHKWAYTKTTCFGHEFNLFSSAKQVKSQRKTTYFEKANNLISRRRKS